MGEIVKIKINGLIYEIPINMLDTIVDYYYEIIED